jgi:hypothetical protein
MLLICKSVLIDCRPGVVPIVAWVTAYHTSSTLDQYISWRSQDLSRHPNLESDQHSRRDIPIGNEENAAGGNVDGCRWKLFFIRGKHHVQAQRKPHRAANFLTRSARNSCL